MSTNEKMDPELILKQLTHKLLKEKLDQLKSKNKEDRSFIYLEGDTLSLLLMYFVKNIEKQETNHSPLSKEKNFLTIEIINELDTLMIKNINEFENIIEQLKNNE